MSLISREEEVAVDHDREPAIISDMFLISGVLQIIRIGFVGLLAHTYGE